TTASNSNPSGRQGICPSGWHVPSDAEWCQLETYLDPTLICTDWNERGTDAGGKLKESGTSHWTSPNTGATNSSEFTGLPGGYRASSGPFQMINNGTYIWTSSESGSSRLLRILYYSYSQIARGMNPVLTGSSCRCVKD
ncbi:MAG: hypothetical protein NTW16_03905, partial [Bacteroidetes bacterium]|nr:hypothetical protein [Bacteroidota bacterium]